MKSNRRKFLTKSTAVAAAVALPAAAKAQTTAGEKPVKKVIWPSGKAAGEAAAVQRHRHLRQHGVHCRHRRAFRGRYQGTHQARPR